MGAEQNTTTTNKNKKYNSSSKFSSNYYDKANINWITNSFMSSKTSFMNESNNKSINNKHKENEKNKSEISKYTFVKELGSGGFGKVKLYKETNNPRNLIAVKEFTGINESNFTKAMKKEKLLLSEINHKYIVKYLFSCFDHNNFYIGMEYCENNSLNDLINQKINKKEKIDEIFIWKVAYQTLKALEYLHIEKKVVHNDVKPLNLLLTKNNDIKLSDFGISGVVPMFSNIRSTMQINDNCRSLIFSTPPEFLKDRQTTFKTDIWALGCSLYFLANLELPFEGNREQLEIKYFTK